MERLNQWSEQTSKRFNSFTDQQSHWWTLCESIKIILTHVALSALTLIINSEELSHRMWRNFSRCNVADRKWKPFPGNKPFIILIVVMPLLVLLTLINSLRSSALVLNVVLQHIKLLMYILNFKNRVRRRFEVWPSGEDLLGQDPMWHKTSLTGNHYKQSWKYFSCTSPSF